MEKILINNEYYTHLSTLYTVLNRMPDYLLNNYITDDYIIIRTEYVDRHHGKYDYKSYTDEYTVSITNLWKKTPTLYHIFVPVDKNGVVNRYEYNKIINEIYEAIYDDYKTYMEDK